MLAVVLNPAFKIYQSISTTYLLLLNGFKFVVVFFFCFVFFLESEKGINQKRRGALLARP